MTRGKHAAQAAKRRAEAANETAAELNQTLNTERDAWRQERGKLLNEIQRLKNQHRSEVEKAAAAEIAILTERTSNELANIRDEYQQRASQAIQVVNEHVKSKLPVDDSLKLAVALAENLGVKFGSAIGTDWSDDNRGVRRRVSSNKKLRNAMTFHEDAEKAGRPVLDRTSPGVRPRSA